MDTHTCTCRCPAALGPPAPYRRGAASAPGRESGIQAADSRPATTIVIRGDAPGPRDGADTSGASASPPSTALAPEQATKI